jgi:hypothetical protein
MTRCDFDSRRSKKAQKKTRQKSFQSAQFNFDNAPIYDGIISKQANTTKIKAQQNYIDCDQRM